MKILFIEEDVELRHLLVDFARSQFPEITVIETVDLKEARRDIEHHLPELVFIGIESDSTDLELFQDLSTITYPDRVFIAMTPQDTPRYRKIGLATGADYLIGKDGMLTLELAILIDSFLDQDDFDSMNNAEKVA